jgi:hypothetical protein
MNLKEILLLIAACTIVLGVTYLTVIIFSGCDVKREEIPLNEML